MHTSNTPTHPMPLVLASTSRYRAELLGRLGLNFSAAAPKVDEAQHPEEAPSQRAARLAREKSVALAAQFPQAILIGSDQVASQGEQLFDKPGTQARAIHTLLHLRGKTVNFHTAVCLYHPASGTHIEHTDLTRAELRSDLTPEAITRYVHADNPVDCAGAFKVESLGIALFSAVRTQDPTALIGLPLIAVAEGLRSFGLDCTLGIRPTAAK